MTLWPSATTSEPAIGAAKTATVTIINDDVLAEPIPALSTTALFVLALAVMFVGVKLLR